MQDKLKPIFEQLDKLVADNKPTEQIIPNFIGQSILIRLAREKP